MSEPSYSAHDLPWSGCGFGKAVLCVCRQANIEATKGDRLVLYSQLGLLTELTFDKFMPDGLGLKPREQRNLTLAFNFVKEFIKEFSKNFQRVLKRLFLV